MKLVEKHIINYSNPLFKEIDFLCFKSKNLYNVSLYQIRQHFFETGKYISYQSLQKRFQNEKQSDYYALPTKVSQQIMMIIDRNFKSFFQLNEKHKENNSRSIGNPVLGNTKNNSPKGAPVSKYRNNSGHKPNVPRYKDKQSGRNILVYSVQSLYKSDLKKGRIKLSGTDIVIPAKIDVWYSQGKSNIKQVRIIHKATCYVIEIIYEKEIEIKEVNKNYIAGIDIGLNNLATVTSNQINPFMINGRPLKSINQYFNKKRALLMSYIGTKGKSKRLDKLVHKRNSKISDYLHKSSRLIINELINRKIGTLVIGNNKQWKNNIELGKRNNQNFVSIPHAEFINQLKYKAELSGIEVIITEESYTSKCSFLDNEEIKKHDNYKGKRISRGLFRSENGNVINADVNGSGNIIKKAVPNAFADGIEAIVVRPVRLYPDKIKVCH
jgi:putative transposase